MNRFLSILTWIVRIIMIGLIVGVALIPFEEETKEFIKENLYIFVLTCLLFVLLEYINYRINEKYESPMRYNKVLYKLANNSRAIVTYLCIIYIIFFFVLRNYLSLNKATFVFCFLLGIVVGYNIAYYSFLYMQRNSDKNKE